MAAIYIESSTNVKWVMRYASATFSSIWLTYKQTRYSHLELTVPKGHGI